MLISGSALDALIDHTNEVFIGTLVGGVVNVLSKRVETSDVMANRRFTSDEVELMRHWNLQDIRYFPSDAEHVSKFRIGISEESCIWFDDRPASMYEMRGKNLRDFIAHS